MNVLSLFAGIGGLDLGLEWAGFRTVAFVERDAACQHWLEQHWPAVPIHGDIHTFSGVPLRGLVDLVCGGFPCQPFSVAGKQKGTEDERHLWPEMSRIIREVRPRWVLAENVPGLRTIAADLVLEDLEGQGYTCWPLVVGVDDVGGPHRRKRVWIIGRLGLADSNGSRDRDADELRRIEWASRTGASDAGGERETLAHRNGGGREGIGSGGLLDGERETFGDHADGCGGARSVADASRDAGGVRWPSRPGEPQHPWEAPRLAYTERSRRHRREGTEDRNEQHRTDAGRLEGDRESAGGHSPEGCGVSGPLCEVDSRRDPSDGMADSTSEPPRSAGQPRQNTDPREPESPMGGAVDGLPGGLAGLSSSHRREALKALGNAVSPPCAYYIGRAIMSIEQERVE